MSRRILPLLFASVLVACPPVEGKVGDDTADPDDETESGDDQDDDDDDDEDEDEDEDDEDPATAVPSRWIEYRVVEVDFGCTAEINGVGEDVRADRPDLAELCPDCEAIYEVRTDIDTACGDRVQVVNPYYRGVVGWGDAAVDVWSGMLPPFSDAPAFGFLAEARVDEDLRGVYYTYTGDLGVEDGAYSVYAEVSVE